MENYFCCHSDLTVVKPELWPKLVGKGRRLEGWCTGTLNQGAVRQAGF